MQNRHIIRSIVIILIVFVSLGIFKFVKHKMGIISMKSGISKPNNLILQSGAIGLCLGVGVGVALKNFLSERAILIAGAIGATIGVVIGIIITRKN